MAWAHPASGVAMLRILVTVVGLFLALSVLSPATAQSTDSDAVPPNVRELLRLLEDPAVKAWLQTQGVATPAPASAPADAESGSPSGYLAGRIAAFHQHLD